ncbi:arsenite efflux MFS transporter ArsK [Aquibium sp. ELW1220]|uniref:arsenite efflux MFS transporter ArsK n=1 Tax=Aquibium sp. ELW1220 TaxID=2976766 RepID=UPI0025B125EB|nr:arsenite efflux MFS transporter ArsK [Aquibium sp. ELW1220]MDN2581952.1 arsenite efflux MFS transporter ArsK [Aquibium sp. ELW1220]
MPHPDPKAPPAVIWGLGLTQVVGYGTLFYSFPILAPAIAAEFAVPEHLAFAALSAALFFGSLFAPLAGRLADRHGAGRVMTAGSAVAALALVACALAPGRASFVIALLAMEFAACFVLYSTAFVAIVQTGTAGAQRSITLLTLIAGFASTLFWPLTSALHAALTWREVYLVFAGMNLMLCLPVHGWIARLARRQALAAPKPVAGTAGTADGIGLAPVRLRAVFLLMLGGFAFAGFVQAAILLHMVPLLTGMGLGTAGVLVSTFFGPAQVASRLINMVFGGRLRQSWLAILAGLFLTSGVVLLAIAAPSVPGIAAAVILFGLGSGLFSIVGGTLPLEVFGRASYGAHVGWMSAARQFSTAIAPFAFALVLARASPLTALAMVAVAGAVAVAGYCAVALLARKPRQAAPPA